MIYLFNVEKDVDFDLLKLNLTHVQVSDLWNWLIKHEYKFKWIYLFFISQTSASGSAPPDKDVIPLCTCKISGASFQKMSSSVTFCQAIDSVDGKVRLGIVWEVNECLTGSICFFIQKHFEHFCFHKSDFLFCYKDFWYNMEEIFLSSKFLLTVYAKTIFIPQDNLTDNF